MRNFRVIVTVIILLGMFSCNTRDYNELQGKWSYNNKDGSYGEFWIDENRVLLIDEFMSSKIFDYKLEKDTITILDFDVAPEWKLYVERLSKDNMIINDVNRGYDCYKIDSNVKIETSDTFEKSVYEEVGPRIENGSKLKD